MTPKIYLAFRFHGNFYHSYRGDTADELGFGKDIRIIRHILHTLDEMNQQGLPVQGTWDFENYFSLGLIMPAHCPDLIAGLQRRARQGQDEFQLMSYNNGLVSAQTAREFEEVIRRGITNREGSGLHDLFGDRFYPMVRPQEMMYTPIHLKLYQACGIRAISLYYAALPFNGFSNFIPPLSPFERYNPLTLTYPGIAETLTLMPCYNHGDVADHLTLRRWVKSVRRQQLAHPDPKDLLLLIDMDADDEFWVGFKIPGLTGRFSTASGLKGLVHDVADLDYVRFTTPGAYLESHPPLRTLVIGQDTADGSFDGMASWAEKWSNQRLWSGLEVARILELQTRRLVNGQLPAPAHSLFEESFEERLRLLSTTHFGMAAPVMNITREKIGASLAQKAVKAAQLAFESLKPKLAIGELSLVDYVRGVSTIEVHYPARPSQGLIRLRLKECTPDHLALSSTAGQAIATALIQVGDHREMVFVERFQPAERKDYHIQSGPPHTIRGNPVKVAEQTLENEFLKVIFDRQGHVTNLLREDREYAASRFLNSGITYAKQSYQVQNWQQLESSGFGLVGIHRARGQIALNTRLTADFQREILIAAGLPYIYLRMHVHFPLTPDHRYNQNKALRMEQGWDSRWKEVRPCEINPAIIGNFDVPLRVWKHNYCDHVSRFDLNYGSFSKNETLDSVNNQITHSWVAISNGTQGILVAQNADALSSMAFCPMRTYKTNGGLGISLNPFGSYSGRQYHYGTADTGLGKWLATVFSGADHLQPYAPSYNGRIQEFNLLIAPYEGDAPPEEIQNDAQAFAYPYLVLNDDVWIASPAHRAWQPTGLGEIPSLAQILPD